MKQPSKYQAGVFDFVEHGIGSAIVNACPGSGKTTTLVGVTKRIPAQLTLAFLAFNKSTVEELKQRIQRPATIRTVHSLGYAAIRRGIGFMARLENDKVGQLMETGLPANVRAEYGTLLKRAVSLAKSHAINYRAGPWGELMYQFDLDVAAGDMGEFIYHANQLLRASDDQTDVIDHDDMIRFPVVHGLPMPRFDWVLLDEAQDISVSQRQLIERLLGPSSRLLAVGDPRQSIYSFRGASHTSMDELKEHFDCTVLPLSISYRCPRNVVAYARRLYDDIEPAPGADDGLVYSLPRWQPNDFNAGDLVLCRNNAPLVSLLFALIGAGISARILGSDLVAVLTRIVKKADKDIGYVEHGRRIDAHGIVGKLLAWREQEVRKYRRFGKPEKVAKIQDHTTVLLTIARHRNARTTDELIQAVKETFSRQGSVKLSTIHRAKGLEADRVFILDPDLMPSRFAVQDWQIAQEKNLEYVAITRAKRELVFIRSDAQEDDLDVAAGW